ncbi:hypothetical protein DFH08DRAFT_666755, partial [Mycena albidolilacea]
LSLAERLPLIRGRLDRNGHGVFAPSPLKLRLYLRVPVPAHRKALIRLLLCSHMLGVDPEILRYQERDKPPVPRFARLCRFCHLAMESEAHALLGCSTPSLAAMRASLLRDISRIIPDI